MTEGIGRKSERTGDVTPLIRGKGVPGPVIVAAVSGGPDSAYLLHELVRKKEGRIVVGHVNHGMRGNSSDKDQELVEELTRRFRLEKRIHVITADSFGPGLRVGTGAAASDFPSGFEEKARKVRHTFLKRLAGELKAERIAMAHTADDQVETVLMRLLEGAGIAGFKGIPRETRDGIVRPILDVWKEDIVRRLKKHDIPFRIDASNADTRFERNWVRNVLLPLLTKRYGKTVKKRIFTLGERFRELDDYLEAEAHRWIRKNVGERTGAAGQGAMGGVVFRRKAFSALPSVLRVKILQRICFDRLQIAPNERLLAAMDRNVRGGGPSVKIRIGKGWELANRYEEAIFLAGKTGGMESGGRAGSARTIVIRDPGEYVFTSGSHAGGVVFVLSDKRKVVPCQAKRLAAKGDAEVFDAARVRLPLTVRPLRAGDRIRPFGRDAAGNARDGTTKVKEILIDRKVPRGERWGRPVVCDADGEILWIPGVLRSARAPVTRDTRKAVVLRTRAAK